jgi:hypothetical protein
MTPEVTAEQRQALREADGAGPIQVVDPATQERYILVRADIYAQLQEQADDFDPREAYPFVDKALREDDEHDPALDAYQDPPPGARPS